MSDGSQRTASIATKSTNPSFVCIEIGDRVLLDSTPNHSAWSWMGSLVGRIFEVEERRRRSHGRSAALKLIGCDTEFYITENHVRKYVEPEEPEESEETEVA